MSEASALDIFFHLEPSKARRPRWELVCRQMPAAAAACFDPVSALAAGKRLWCS